MAFCKALDGAFCQELILFKTLLVRRILPFQSVYGENVYQRTSRTVATQAPPTAEA